MTKCMGRWAAALLLLAPVAAEGQMTGVDPLDVARAFAARYPQAPAMGYIPALAWTSSFRLSSLTGDTRWREKALEEMRPFLTGEQPAITDPPRLTALAALAAFSDHGTLDGNTRAGALARQAADRMLAEDPAEILATATGWTDDLYMATSLLARVAEWTGSSRYERAVGRLLTVYASELQREDGLFVHSARGPFAWGRGNGFAALGHTEALARLPDAWPERPRVLEAYRRHMQALLDHQSEDGSWHQVVDEPGSYRELTVTATAVTAMARGIRHGWLDPEEFLPAVRAGWRAVTDRIDSDGTVRNVCTSTGAGPTLQYYLDRPEVNGLDDRGGGLVLVAAIEMEELSQALPRG